MSLTNGDDGSSELAQEDSLEIENPYENKILLVNELLCYISNYVNFGSAAPDNIRRIILSSFDEKDISTAKKVLWNKAKAGVLKKY